MKQVKEMGIVAVCLMLLGFGICMGIGTYLMYRDGEEEYDTLREYVDVEEPKENADSEDTEENQEEYKKPSDFKCERNNSYIYGHYEIGRDAERMLKSIVEVGYEKLCRR